ncbi:nucleotide-binding protein [Pseudomonas sp. WS 5019]|nr:nucleotide-binding protein [Pseudomonas sp. WS 5019]NMY16014.1 nucleotide-binding protein [Pseudomonas sp. WS 5019]
MNKQQVLSGLESFRERLLSEVVSAYEQRGSSFGRDRFNTWRRKLTQFLNDNLPGEVSTLNSKLSHIAFVIHRGETDAQRFWREDGETMLSYIDSLMLDVNNDEYDFPKDHINEATAPLLPFSIEKDLTKVFIVHGHDGEAKERTARFIEKLGFKAIILHEQASRGQTIIEKFEKYSNVGFAVVLYTPDDLGNAKSGAEKGELKARARQNVIFEHGYLMGKLGRANVVPLVAGSIELPSDISGIVYITDKDWQVDIAKEMKDAGYEIDFNKLL